MKKNDFPLYFYDSLESTNEKLKEITEEKDIPEFSVVMAGHQTAGKGQEGNSWESEKGKNLTVSILLKPDFLSPANQFYISKIVSIALLWILKELSIESKIKWPNDIYVGDKKIAGILIENKIMGNTLSESIVGIGLNVNQQEFLSGAKNPVSIKDILNKDVDINDTLENLLEKLMFLYKGPYEGETDTIDEAYLKNLYRREGIFSFRDINGEFQAEISDIETSGILVLRDTKGNVRRYAFKEVEFV